jgi:hypothetical protein
MKILTVNYEWPPLGGGGVAMRDVDTELSKRHEVHVLTSGANGLLPEESHHDTWFSIPSGPTGVHVVRYDGLPHLLSIIGGDI